MTFGHQPAGLQSVTAGICLSMVAGCRVLPAELGQSHVRSPTGSAWSVESFDTHQKPAHSSRQHEGLLDSEQLVQ